MEVLLGRLPKLIIISQHWRKRNFQGGWKFLCITNKNPKYENIKGKKNAPLQLF